MISSRLAGRDSLLFVYGTLRPFVDIEMAKWLRHAARYLGSGTTRGRLYDLGAYPGMSAARARGERVVGDLYRVSNPRVLRVLDRYEAGAHGKARFMRERCEVELDRGGRKISVGLSISVQRRDGRAHRERRLPVALRNSPSLSRSPAPHYVNGLRFATSARARCDHCRAHEPRRLAREIALRAS